MEKISEKIQKQLESLEIVIKNVTDIKPDPENPKDHSDEQIEKLCQSMETAWTNPIIVDENNMVIAGHGRLMAAQKLKLDRVPCIVLTGLTEAEKIQLQIFDNKSGEMSIWNIDKLCIKIDQLRDRNADLDLTGFTEREISDIFDGANNQNADDEENEKMDTVPAAPEKPQTKPGDVWTIGRHKLICGDSTDMSVVGRLMDGAKAGMVFTDPPYNTGMTDNRQVGRLVGFFNDSFTEDEWQKFMSSFCATYYAIMKENSVAYICLDWRRNYELIPHIKQYFELSNIIVWDKVVHGLGSDYKYTYELINVCKKGKPELNTHQGDREYQDVWHIQRKIGRDEDHCTKKPVELCARAIRHGSLINDIVVDLFGGSGSTMIACEKTNRVCRMAELDPKYCEVIIRRFIDTFGGVAINQDGVEFKVD